MTNRFQRAVPGAIVLLCVLAPAASAVPVTVNLRVEGPTRTVFDGPVTTDAHDVTTASGGTHRCDGTNGGAEPSPVPTATGALDDAARLAGFTIDGPYGSFGIEDFFLERVADERIDPNTGYWSLWINHVFSDKGGCQKRVLAGQDVLWAGIPFSVDVPLKLSGPAAARTGEPVELRVIDGQTGAPQAGAVVGGATTDSEGRATLAFADEGIYRLKADKPGTIRSNTIALCVDPPEAAPCSSTDQTGPLLQTLFEAGDSALPGRTLASARSRSRTILVSWAGDDGDGSGIAHYSAAVSRMHLAAGAGPTAPVWESLVDKAPVNGVHFRGESGAAYRFRITASDRALNSTTIESAPVLIPVDDRDRSLVRFTRGWQRVQAARAWGRTVMRARRSGAVARMRFSGTRLALLGRRLPRGGRLRVTIDGRSATIRARGRTSHRGVLWVSRRLDAGDHSLRLRSLGGGPVEIDALAPSP